MFNFMPIVYMSVSTVFSCGRSLCDVLKMLCHEKTYLLGVATKLDSKLGRLLKFLIWKV